MPLFSFSLIDYAIHKKEHIHDANELLIDLSTTIEHDLWLQSKLNEQLLYTISLHSELDPEVPGACADFLKSYTEKYQMVAYLRVANLEGDVICGYPGWNGQINIKNREYYKNVIENEKYSNGYFIISRISHLPSIIYAYPFKSIKNNDKGYILLAVQNLNDIYNFYIKNPSLENIDVVFYDFIREIYIWFTLR